MDLNTGLLLLVLVTMISALSYGLKKLWSIDNNVLNVCRDARDNHDGIKDNKSEIKLLERKTVKRFEKVDGDIAEIREDILSHNHPVVEGN